MGVIIGRQMSMDGVIMWPLTGSMKEMVGKRYGRLIVLNIGWKKRSFSKSRYFISCICDCGKECIVGLEKLKTGHTQSCGCLHTEKIIKTNTKHGDSNWAFKNGKEGAAFSIIYSKWQSVKARCLYPSTEGYAHYGAIGITICDGYRYNYDLFKSDLGEQPTPQHSLDRKDTHGNYSCGKCDQCKKNGWPMNIRWADEDTQRNNKRNAVIFDYNGERLTAAQISRKIGIPGNILRNRVRRGWSKEKAILTPLRKNNKR